MKLTPGQVLRVDNAWRLHPYANDEFCIESHGEGRMFVATHDGRDVTVLRPADKPKP